MRSCPLSPRCGGATDTDGVGRGLKHAAAVGTVSRTRHRLRGMAGKGNVSKALVLRIVKARSLSGLVAPDPNWEGDQVRWVLTVCRRTCGIPRCTEAP
jgi:hypothetical protein